MKFIDAVIRDDLDDEQAKLLFAAEMGNWARAPGSGQVHDWLGMTEVEHRAYVSTGTIAPIKAARHELQLGSQPLTISTVKIRRSVEYEAVQVGPATIAAITAWARGQLKWDPHETAFAVGVDSPFRDEWGGFARIGDWLYKDARGRVTVVEEHKFGTDWEIVE